MGRSPPDFMVVADNLCSCQEVDRFGDKQQHCSWSGLRKMRVDSLHLVSRFHFVMSASEKLRQIVFFKEFNKQRVYCC